MSNNRLTNIQKRRLEIMFNDGGYTPKIASSDDKLERLFTLENIDIMEFRKPNGIWLSKGNTMSVFWENGTDQQILRILKAILSKLEVDHETNSYFDYTKEIGYVKEVINSLIDNGIRVEVEPQTITKEKLMPHINKLIEEEQYVLALDKVHTLLVHLLKEKLGSYIDTSRRHSIKYLIQQILLNYNHSEVIKQKLTGDMNFSDIFNDARNNGSFAHDNEGNLVTECDAKIMCETFIITINIVDNL